MAIERYRNGWNDEEQEPETEGFGLIDDEDSRTRELIDRGGISITQAVAPSSAVFHVDYFTLNDMYCRVMYLEIWPNEVPANWLRDLYQFQRAVDISIFYQPLPRTAMVKRLKAKTTREMSEMMRDAKNGAPEDFEREQRLAHAQSLQRELQQGSSKAFQVGLMINVHAHSLEELNDLSARIEKIIAGMNASTRRAELRQRDGLLSCLPYGRNYLADAFSTRNMQTDAAAYTFPFANADLSHPTGIWYGVNCQTNSNVILNRFQLDSPHSIILGASGTGKSMAAKQEMMRALMRRWPVMVIDPDGECRRMAQHLGGQYIDIAPSSKDRINVLDFSHAADGQQDQLTPKMLSVIRLIGVMMNPGGTGYGLNAAQVELLQAMLRDLYKDFQYTQDPRTQLGATRERMPILSDLRARLVRFVEDNGHRPELQALADQIRSALSPYCGDGIYSALFDQKTTVDLRSDFVVFNIKELTRDQHLQTLGMHNVLEFIWITIMNERQRISGQPRLLFVDEAHVMMRNLESAQFLEDIARRARKCNVGLTVLTQEPKDFLREDRPQGQLIFANSSMQIIMRMKRNSLELLQDLMGLDDAEIDLLATRPNGEGMVFALNDRAWIDMHTSSPYEYMMITTNPQEVARIEEIFRAELERGDEEDGLAGQIGAPRPQLPSGDSGSAAAPMVFEVNPDGPALAAPRRPQLGQPEPISQIGRAPASDDPLHRPSGPPKPLEPPVPPVAPGPPQPPINGPSPSAPPPAPGRFSRENFD